MRTYEIVLMLHPSAGNSLAETVKQYLEYFSSWSENGFEYWGKRTLAYPIKDCSSAYYLILNVNAQTSELDRFEEQVRLDSRVLRHLTLRFADKTEPSAMLTPDSVKLTKQLLEQLQLQ